MKNTIASMIIFSVLTFLFSKTCLALVPLQPREDLQIKVTFAPTATPTPITFKKIEPNIDFKILPTIENKVSPTPTKKVEVTPSVTPEPTQKTELTATPIISPKPSTEAIKTAEEVEDKLDLKTLFMGITVGLLILIILIQIWPKKKKLD